MFCPPPHVVIRLGSHAEKEYVIKLDGFLDGIIVGANLFEATPGATASLLLRLGSRNTHLYVDPMTYAFGAYLDPSIGNIRTDLDWIKSDQTRKLKGVKTTIRDIKRSYRRLSENLGAPLTSAVSRCEAVSPSELSDQGVIESFCISVVRYQLDRMNTELERDEELREHIGDAPRPAAVFAPYFYIEPSNTASWLDSNLGLMSTAAALNLDVPVHGILCADFQHLKDEDTLRRFRTELPDTGISGVWLWFSGFYEDGADEGPLSAYKELVEGLSRKLEVHAMHGGLFSLMLSKFGMTGVSHGMGYGEQKNVVPVIGQSIPMVRYYLPPLARRLGVPDIERAFGALGVKTPSDFHSRICNCAVCRGVVATTIDEFSSFGDMYFSRPTAARPAQTPAAAKRCRFHFLLSRIRERDEIRQLELPALLDRLRYAAGTWGVQPSLLEHSNHLSKWVGVLESP